MRRSVGLRELRADLTSILRRVSEEREVVEVTKHGRAIARIVPILAPAKPDEPVGSAWADMDRLAAEIGRHWRPDPMSGPDAVSADRRG
jgi:prevent-host-death family protein